MDQMGPKGLQRGSTGGLRGDKRGSRGVPDYTKSSGQFDKGFHEVVPNFLSLYISVNIVLGTYFTKYKILYNISVMF